MSFVQNGNLSYTCSKSNLRIPVVGTTIFPVGIMHKHEHTIVEYPLHTLGIPIFSSAFALGVLKQELLKSNGPYPII